MTLVPSLSHIKHIVVIKMAALFNDINCINIERITTSAKYLVRCKILFTQTNPKVVREGAVGFINQLP